jgi:hypothetical protein
MHIPCVGARFISGPFWIPLPFRDGEKRKTACRPCSAFAGRSPLWGSVLNGNAQNPTACAGNVGLDDESGLYSLFRPTTKLSFLTPFSRSERKTSPEHVLNPCRDVSLRRYRARDWPRISWYVLEHCRYRSPIGDCSPLAGSGQVSLWEKTGRSHPISTSSRPYKRGVPDLLDCWIGVVCGVSGDSFATCRSSSRTIVTSDGALIPIFTRSPSTANTDTLITPASTILSPTFRRNTSMQAPFIKKLV